MNSVLTRTLLRLMAVANDTNILYRKDIQTLRKVQHLAQRVLEAENHAVEAERYARLMDYCRREYVSPGGSADLLAVTVFLYFVEHSFPALSKLGTTA